jgi:hypothetical protein
MGPGVSYTTGRGHLFLSHSCSLLSVLSPRESRFKDEAIKVPKWLLNAIKTKKEKEAFDSDVLLDLV